LKILSDRADALLTEARQLDIPLDVVMDILRRRDAALSQGRKGEMP
jgi:hypothetical protein